MEQCGQQSRIFFFGSGVAAFRANNKAKTTEFKNGDSSHMTCYLFTTPTPGRLTEPSDCPYQKIKKIIKKVIRELFHLFIDYIKKHATHRDKKEKS